MSSPQRKARRHLVLKLRLVDRLIWLVCSGILVLSGCGFGNQGNSDVTSNILNGMVAISASDVWAVGSATGLGSGPLIEHWNGQDWGQVPAPGKGEGSSLESVAALSAKDVWAVGNYSEGEDRKTLIEHWNGSSWRVVSSPNGPGDNVLEGVAVVSATDVWAVGENDPCYTPPPALAAPRQGNALVLVRQASRADVCKTHPFPPPSR